jgi:Kdo2-lipid IVA lauroyltransferase/acyltransferase
MSGVLRAITGGLALLPHRWVVGLGGFLGWGFGALVRYHRRDAVDALRRCLPEIDASERARILRRMYRNLGRNMAETMVIPSRRREVIAGMIDVQGEHNLRAALEQGRGVILLAAHLGNWEFMTLVPTLLGFPPLTIIAKRIRNDAIHTYWNELRARLNIRVAPPRHSMRECLRALRRNELVGFMLDQNMIWKEGIFVNFFGRTACTTPGLALMSAKAKAPVVPALMRRMPDGRHLVRFERPLPPPPDRDPATVHAATQQYTRWIEDRIRECPEQWIWIHRRWKTRIESIPPWERERFILPDVDDRGGQGG